MERATGIEPVYLDWQPSALPTRRCSHGAPRRSRTCLFSFVAKSPHPEGGAKSGAGGETRTPVTGLEDQGLSLWTTPAQSTLFSCQRAWRPRTESNRLDASFGGSPATSASRPLGYATGFEPARNRFTACPLSHLGPRNMRRRFLTGAPGENRTRIPAIPKR